MIVLLSQPSGITQTGSRPYASVSSLISSRSASSRATNLNAAFPVAANCLSTSGRMRC